MKRNFKIRNRYRNYLSIEAIVIVLVMVCFHYIPDKKWASLVASSLFLGSVGGIFYWEGRFPDHKKRPSYWGALIFLFFNALPISLLRLFYWELPFEQIELGGLKGSQMHQISNFVFMIMLICFFMDSYRETVKAREELMRSQQ